MSGIGGFFRFIGALFSIAYTLVFLFVVGVVAVAIIKWAFLMVF